MIFAVDLNLGSRVLVVNNMVLHFYFDDILVISHGNYDSLSSFFLCGLGNKNPSLCLRLAFVWFDEQSRNDLDAIRSTLISTPDDSRVALGTVADVIETKVQTRLTGRKSDAALSFSAMPLTVIW